MTLEPFARPFPSPAQFLSDLSPQLIANAFVAFIFAASGPVAILLAVGRGGGLGDAELASWVFGAFAINGVISVLMCLVYRQPLVFFWTIPGIVLVGPALQHLSFNEVVGAYLATGLLMALLGVTGWVRKVMALFPTPIVMAMVAGVFLKFGTDWVLALRGDFWLAGPMTAVFILLMAVPMLGSRMPPLIGALIVGVVIFMAAGGFEGDPDLSFKLVDPVISTPAFSLQAMAELVVPLAVTVLVVQNGQGFGVLLSARHDPPVNTVSLACGVGSLAAGMVGTVCSCLTGPTNAIIVGEGKPQQHYAPGIVVGLLAILFGLFSPVFTQFLLAAPAAFIVTLAGLAMLRVLQAAFVAAFSGAHVLGALITFLVTVSNISILNIGAAFWGLVFGYAVSRLIEKADFGAGKEEGGG